MHTMQPQPFSSLLTKSSSLIPPQPYHATRGASKQVLTTTLPLSLKPLSDCNYYEENDTDYLSNAKAWEKNILSIIPKKRHPSIKSALKEMEQQLEMRPVTEEETEKKSSHIIKIYTSHTQAVNMKSTTQEKIRIIFFAAVLRQFFLKKRADSSARDLFRATVGNTPFLASSVASDREFTYLFRFYRAVKLIKEHLSLNEHCVNSVLLIGHLLAGSHEDKLYKHHDHSAKIKEIRNFLITVA